MSWGCYQGGEEFVDGREESLGVIGARVNQVRVVSGPGRFQGIFVLLEDLGVGLKVNCEVCFLVKSFQLSFTGFHIVKFRGVPGSRVGECDCFGFKDS